MPVARRAHLEELCRRPGGKVVLGGSVQTGDGVRVADVAWISDERYARFGDATPFPGAPELCVEIKSPSNSRAALTHKASLYLEAGACEVWIVPIDCERRVLRA